MKKLKRGAAIYLDEEQQKESAVNRYLNCRDGVIEVLEYKDNSGYGLDTRLFLCRDMKHEIISIIKQSKISYDDEWMESEMCFDTDSFDFLVAIINGITNQSGSQYTLVRDYNTEFF